jgi:hypothetical protein
LRLAGMALAAAALLAGCEETLAPPATPRPEPRPEVYEPSAGSRQLARYYADVQDRLTSQGLLRTDGGGPDVPFSARQLAENFERVALYDEYTIAGGRFVAQQTPSRLRRWEQPIRMRVIFGRSSPPERQARDRENIASYARRLARLTGVDIRLTEGKANFLVLVLDRDELADIAPRLEGLLPGIGSTTTNEIAALPRGTFCSAYAFSDSAASSAYGAAVTVIRAEHPDLLRLSCIHEEIAQAMGLANDSPAARPSIFNDDEEFALLTRHDELLLQMLYDRRLQLGMTPATARPMVQLIAADLLGGES